MASNRFFDVDVSDFENAVKELERFKKQAIPFYMRDALNSSAFAAQTAWRAEARKEMTLRNHWTERSIRYDKARGSNPARMFAVVGSTEDYMRDREQGRPATGQHPMPAASNEAAWPRKRLVARNQRIGKIQLGQRGRTGSKKQRNAITLRLARKQGSRFAALDERTGGTGIYRIKGKRKLKVTRLWGLGRTRFGVEPMPTLQRSVEAVNKMADQIHKKALVRQLRHHGLFGH